MKSMVFATILSALLFSGAASAAEPRIYMCTVLTPGSPTQSFEAYAGNSIRIDLPGGQPVSMQDFKPITQILSATVGDVTFKIDALESGKVELTTIRGQDVQTVDSRDWNTLVTTSVTDTNGKSLSVQVGCGELVHE